MASTWKCSFNVVMVSLILLFCLPGNVGACTNDRDPWNRWQVDECQKDQQKVCSDHTALVPDTGQLQCFDDRGKIIPCGTGIGKGQDADLKKGVNWPNPRFIDNKNGTITDDLTGLIWLKNANCFGPETWVESLNFANTMGSGVCGLTDGSKAGDWRLPNVRELQSLIDYGFYKPALSNSKGTGQWKEGDAFSGLQLQNYWSSTPSSDGFGSAWFVSLYYGTVSGWDTKLNVTPDGNGFYILPVRNVRSDCKDKYRNNDYWHLFR